ECRCGCGCGCGSRGAGRGVRAAGCGVRLADGRAARRRLRLVGCERGPGLQRLSPAKDFARPRRRSFPPLPIPGPAAARRCATAELLRIDSEKFGLVLSGGGARGAYQIGVWKAMHELGLDRRVKAVAGTSVGAINTALFLQGDVDRAVEADRKSTRLNSSHVKISY